MIIDRMKSPETTTPRNTNTLFETMTPFILILSRISVKKMIAMMAYAVEKIDKNVLIIQVNPELSLDSL
jgi:hypothetical protein